MDKTLVGGDDLPEKKNIKYIEYYEDGTVKRVEYYKDTTPCYHQCSCNCYCQHWQYPVWVSYGSTTANELYTSGSTSVTWNIE